MARPLTYEEDYWDRVDLKCEFIRFLVQIHNLDLTRWDKAGFWDRAYRPFSFFDGARLVVNVCVYSMDMMVAGRRRRAAQISAVGTDPAYRRQGLALELSRKALEWARPRHDLFFLFADEEAFGLYQKIGFRRVPEHKARRAVSGRPPVTGAVSLDVSRLDELQMIHRLALGREPVSDRLGLLNDRLLMFWCLYGHGWQISYIDDLKALVLFGRKDRLLTIFDVVGAKTPEFDRLYPYIADPDDESVEFLFMPDRMGLRAIDWIVTEANGAHVLGDFSLADSRLIFPYTCHA